MAPKLARPAAAVGRAPRRAVRRRPAAQVAPPAGESWKGPQEVKLEEYPEGTKVAVKGRFWEAEVEVAGEVTGARIEKGEKFLHLKAQGTKSESLLRSLTGASSRHLDLHLCQVPCQSLTWRDGLVHLSGVRKTQGALEDWMDNLGEPPVEREEEDLNAELRAEAEEARIGLMKEAKNPKEKASGSKDKKEKKEKKEKRKIRGSAGKKELDQLFGGTALDPDPSVRRQALKKAKKVKKKSKKKKKKKGSGTGSSSSSSSSASTSSQAATVEIFDGEREAHRLWRRTPGSLALVTIMEAQQHLLTRLGVRPDVETGELPPILTQYFRASLQPVMSPALSRESLHWATLVDLLLQGETARATDLACQRLKGLEAYAKGVHIDVSRRLELIPGEKESLTRPSEVSQAGKEVAEEDKVHKRTRTEGKGKSDTSFWGGKKGGKGDGKKGKNDKKGDAKGKDEGKQKAT